VLVSVIDNDERNLLTSLLGRQLGVHHIIIRVSRRANPGLFERAGIDVALSGRGAAVASVLELICAFRQPRA
jgi:trk system potassium uptake protein TrkA